MLYAKVFKKGITPVSCRLKSTIKTPRSYNIIRIAKRQLFNERVRQINHTLYVHDLKRNICTKKLENLIAHNREDLQEC